MAIASFMVGLLQDLDLLHMKKGKEMTIMIRLNQDTPGNPSITTTLGLDGVQYWQHALQ